MSFQREKLEFGRASFVGVALNDPAFHELSPQDQAKVIGWAVGCPVVEELTDPRNPDPGRGPEAMLPRYGEVAFWSGYISRAAEELNPALHAQLAQSVTRLKDEPIGKYEPESVPESYITEIPPTETLVGYTLPRLLTKQLGGTEVPRAEKQARLVQGIDILDNAIVVANSPEELLALTAERMARDADVDPLTTLSTVLSVGWYSEHNADHMVRSVKQALKASAPQLWKLYSNLSEQAKAAQKIL
jgi:hypothetical protein